MLAKIRAITSMLLFTITFPQYAQAKSNFPDAAAWSQAQAKSGNQIDFDFYCTKFNNTNTSRIPSSSEFDASAVTHLMVDTEPCRTITTTDLITDISDAAKFNRLMIKGMILLPNNTSQCPNKNELCIDLQDEQSKLRVDITHSYFAGRLYADNAHFLSLYIANSDVAGSVNLENVTVDDFLSLNSVSVGSLLDLTSLKTGTYLSLSDVNVLPITRNDNPRLLGPYLSIGTNVYLIGSFISPINLSYSNIGGNIFLENSAGKNGFSIHQLTLNGVLVSGSLLTRPENAYGDVDNNSTLQQLGLADAILKKQFDLSALSKGSWQPATKLAQLDLTNASVGSFADCRDSWPQSIKIDDFSYQSFHPTELDSNGCPEFLSDTNGQLNWLKRNLLVNNTFNPQPYAYLATHLEASGSKAAANTILYHSRLLETYYRLRSLNYKNVSSWPAVFLSTFILVITGDGIGWYPAFHLLIVISLSLSVGVWKIRQSPGIRPKSSAGKAVHNTIWCIGACLERLLPIIELRKEFKDYFEEDENLTDSQKVFFVLYSLWGWLVGLLFAAALSGLAQSS